MPCLPTLTRFAATGLLVAAAGVASAQTPTPAPAQAAAAPAAESELVSRARLWLSGRYQAAPAAFGIQPPDPRTIARGCAGGWLYDQPFPANEAMLRARCPDTQAQVFLQVKLPPRPAAEPGAGTVAATTPAAPTAPATPALPPAAAAVTAAPAPQAMAAPRPAPAAPVMAAPVAPPPVLSGPALVRRGQVVLTTWAPVPGLQVNARLEAMDDGRLGETIRLKNRESGRIVSAIVNGQNTAQGL